MNRFRIAIAAIAILSASFAAPAAADDDLPGGGSSTVAPLTGETFATSEIPLTEGELVITSGECDPTANSTFTFEVTGVATGPYPGMFTETGTVTLGDFGNPMGGSLELVAFESTFEILSPTGAFTVTGTKTLVDPIGSVGLCGEAAFEGRDPNSLMVQATVRYTADIVTPLGSATDTGTSLVDMGDIRVRGEPDVNGFSFSEVFTSTGITPGGEGCPDDDDDDGDDDDGDDDCEEGDD